MNKKGDPLNKIGVTEHPRPLNPGKAIAMPICPITVHFSGALADQRAAKRSPIVIMGKKKKPMKDFRYGYHGKRYCSWARTHDDGVAQHGGHTPKIC